MNRNKPTATVMALFAAGFILLATAAVGVGQSTSRPTLIFTSIQNPEAAPDPIEDYRAAILIRDRAAWRLIYLPEQYDNAGWEYAGRSKSKPEVWGIAQFGREGLGGNLEIAHSLNDGRTWTHHSLQKKSRLATFKSFSMGVDGKGSLTIHLEENEDIDVPGGYYTYTTANGGRTWSQTPRYSKTEPPAGTTSLESITTRDRISVLPCAGT